MTKKVYWKELREELEDTYRYIARWTPKLQNEDISGLTAPQLACIAAVLAAVTECLALLPVDTPVE